MSAESPTIMIVDDEEAVLNICKRLLQKMGYNVLGANNSGDAYRIANENKGTIAAAIIDYSLPSIKDESVPKRLNEIDPALKS
jgi:two-component system cell cycle sensor histidine kinase/response regulator CckA